MGEQLLTPEVTERVSTGPAAEDEYAQAFSMAKNTLSQIATVQVPPVPRVYEVFYRYVEGGNDALDEQLRYLIDNSQTITQVIIEQLHSQFLSGNDANDDLRVKLSGSIANELQQLHAAVREQLNAGEEFSNSVKQVCDKLNVTDISQENVQKLVRIALAINQQLRQHLHELTLHLEDSQPQIDKLRRCLQQLQKSVITDPLTGVGNRRLFDTILNQATKHPPTNGQQVYLLLVDIDEFNRINQTFGWETGDEVLRVIAAQMQHIAKEAAIARHGGDEFSLFLNGSEGGIAYDLAHRLSQCFRDKDFTLTDSAESIGRLSMSIGIARLRPNDSRESWYERADRLLSGAKLSGGNCVHIEPNFNAVWH